MLALAYRVRLLELDKQRIQSDAKQRLEQRVEERTAELGAALQELSDANAQLERISQFDKLTGVYNRNYFDVHFIRQWRSAVRGDYPLGLLMIDVDHFKRINDDYGHLNGDKVLAAVAAAIAGALRRTTDMLARYGGEEFVTLLPHTDPVGCEQVAELIREAVARVEIQFDGEPIEPRVSIGLAWVMPRDGGSEQGLLAAADRALYAAKAGGRNRVVAAKPESMVAAAAGGSA